MVLKGRLKETYARSVFPWILDRMLGGAEIDELRRESLRPARGRTLEVGFGTGLNLSCFPLAVTELTIIDSELMLEPIVTRRIAAAQVPVRRLQVDAQVGLPFPEDSFDCVVTTFTLCSIDRLDAALAEIRRVLRPGAPYLFLEHGRSDHPGTAGWQDRLNPLQRIVGAGCNLNRRIDRLIAEAGLQIDQLDRLRLPRAPRLIGELYRGCARKCDQTVTWKQNE